MLDFRDLRKEVKSMKWLLVLVSLCLLFLPMVLGPPVLSITPAIESPTAVIAIISLWVIAGIALTLLLYVIVRTHPNYAQCVIRPLRLSAIASAGLIPLLSAK